MRLLQVREAKSFDGALVVFLAVEDAMPNQVVSNGPKCSEQRQALSGLTACAHAEELGGGLFFLSESPVMKTVQARVADLARFDFPVLILGETGTGKEIVARLIHAQSTRASRPFWNVNCAALPRELLESELFGHEDGAFTGTKGSKPGQFELCHNGTILLDEFTEMEPALQAKLLQVLQDGQFRRLGGRSAVTVSVRTLAATNVNIPNALTSGKLREDIYHRLNVFCISLPPLRERQEDILPLLNEFIARLSRQYSIVSKPVSAALSSACMRYQWPGNVRELMNFAKRFIAENNEEQLLGELGAERTESFVPRLLQENVSLDGGLKMCIRALKEEFEKTAIAQALQQTGGRTVFTARLLKISLFTVSRTAKT